VAGACLHPQGGDPLMACYMLAVPLPYPRGVDPLFAPLSRVPSFVSSKGTGLHHNVSLCRSRVVKAQSLEGEGSVCGRGWLQRVRRSYVRLGRLLCGHGEIPDSTLGYAGAVGSTRRHGRLPLGGRVCLSPGTPSSVTGGSVLVLGVRNTAGSNRPSRRS